jgi:hypothetical protein
MTKYDQLNLSWNIQKNRNLNLCHLSKKRIRSDQSLALSEKIAAACEEPARN